MGYYTLFKGTDYQYYFNLKASNSETILRSEGYTTRQAALNGIESVRVNSPYDERYERKTSNNHKPFFVLKARNGETIGVSEMYESVQARENGIESVKRNGPTSDVREL